MNNDALVAALGMDAVAAVHGYRLGVLAEAAARGHLLTSAPLSQVVVRPEGALLIDPLDIRLRFGASAHRPAPAGRTLSWCPATGWSAGDGASTALRYFAGPSATPLDLLPTPAEVVDWATAPTLDGHGHAPAGVDIDDDPEAIRRLLAFLDPGLRARAHEAFAPTTSW